MDDKTLLVIGVALVVSVIASYATTTMMGNVIKVNPDIIGQDVYTKADIDNKLNNLSVNQFSVKGVFSAAMVKTGSYSFPSSPQISLIGTIHKDDWMTNIPSFNASYVCVSYLGILMKSPIPCERVTRGS